MKQRIGSIAVRLFVLGFVLHNRLGSSITRVFISMAGISKRTFALCLFFVLLTLILGLDSVYGKAMLRNASPQRMIHLEQALANQDHLAELSRKSRQEMKEPSRG